MDKANEETQNLHQENPDGTPNPTRAIPLTKPNWYPNRNGLPLLEHYKRCLLEGLKKGVPKQKSLSTEQAVLQKPTEDTSDFLERTYEAYRKYTGQLDQQAPENIRRANMPFLCQSAPDIRTKLQKLEEWA